MMKLDKSMALKGASALGLLVVVAACSAPTKGDYATRCIADTGAVGGYTYPDGLIVPTVEPALDGNAEDAARINSCIRQLAAADGLSVGSTGGANRVVIQNGQRTVIPAEGDPSIKRTVTYTPTAKERRAIKRGERLPLPTEYQLQIGDAELWRTMTLAQQKRALLFLKDGGTIRSSLQTD